MDKRKFPRVDFKKFKPDVQKIIGAAVLWPSGETSPVFDLSHTGAALSSPKEQKLKVGDILKITFEIQGKKQADVSCKIVRVGEHVVGVQFAEMNTQARMSFEKFLQSKLMGLNVRLVNPHFYGAKEDFTFWFHGPNDFNVFLWKKGKGLGRVLVELGADLLLFENNEFSQGVKSNEPSDTDGRWVQKNIPGMNMLMQQTLEILTQVQESKELLEPFIEVLTQRATKS